MNADGKLHGIQNSDMKDVAYYYNFRMFKFIVEQGRLK